MSEEKSNNPYREWWIVVRDYEPGDDEFDWAYDYEQTRIDYEVVRVIEHSTFTALEVENETLHKERDEYKRLAESWMADYNKLKEKHYPLVGVYGSTEEISKLDKETKG
jgi:hypothetical protein